MTPIIVGESNPYGSRPEYALYPSPPGCAGDRLCRVVMQLRERTYLSSFERVNLLSGDRWSAPAAREAALELLVLYGSRVWILLGRKVADAFDRSLLHPPPRFYVLCSASSEMHIVALPHPSGRNRAWSDPQMARRCREVLASALPSIPFGETRSAVENCQYCINDPHGPTPCPCEHAPCVHRRAL